MEFNSWTPYKYITALTTKRKGGLSKGPFRELNLAFHVGDKYNDVLANRKLLLDALKLDQNHLVTTFQSHSDVIKKVTLHDAGAGATSFESGVAADALYTYEKHLALAIFHADCVPVFLFDKVKKWVAIVHAGMTGTLKSITKKSVAHLIENEGSNPEDIHAYLGPALAFDQNPIDEKMMHAILAMNPDFHYAIKKSEGVYYLDVPLLNFGQLRDIGIPSNNITASGIDTFSNKDDYFSYAREKVTGRHLSLILLNR